jgi:hypothetical protein
MTYDSSRLHTGTDPTLCSAVLHSEQGSLKKDNVGDGRRLENGRIDAPGTKRDSHVITAIHVLA